MLQSLLDKTQVIWDVSSAVVSWLDFTKVIAMAGLSVALINSYFTWQNRKLVDRQEARRSPKLVASLAHAFLQNKKGEGGRMYAFLVTVRNPSDSNNAISEADLAVTYLTKERVQLTVKLRADETAQFDPVQGKASELRIPVSIPAHDTVSGWLYFRMPPAMAADITIESYSLILTDTHGKASEVVPILIQEYRDEA